MMKVAKEISKFTVNLKLNQSFKIGFYEKKYNTHQIFNIFQYFPQNTSKYDL